MNGIARDGVGPLQPAASGESDRNRMDDIEWTVTRTEALCCPEHGTSSRLR